MEGKSETQFSPDTSSKFSFSFALKLEGSNYPSSVAALPTSSSSTALLGYVHPAHSSEFSFSFELEGGTDASTVATTPPYSAFLL